MCVRLYSQAIAIAVCEGRFGELHNSSPAFPDDFGGATQQLLGFGKRFGQLFLPLHELWITLQRERENDDQLFYFSLSSRWVRINNKNTGKWYYLALHHKLLSSFDAQQDALLVFDVRFLHRHNLLHRQQVLLWRKWTSQKGEKAKCSKQTTDIDASELKLILLDYGRGQTTLEQKQALEKLVKNKTCYKILRQRLENHRVLKGLSKPQKTTRSLTVEILVSYPKISEGVHTVPVVCDIRFGFAEVSFCTCHSIHEHLLIWIFCRQFSYLQRGSTVVRSQGSLTCQNWFKYDGLVLIQSCRSVSALQNWKLE